MSCTLCFCKCQRSPASVLSYPLLSMLKCLGCMTQQLLCSVRRLSCLLLCMISLRSTAMCSRLTCLQGFLLIGGCIIPSLCSKMLFLLQLASIGCPMLRTRR